MKTKLDIIRSLAPDHSKLSPLKAPPVVNRYMRASSGANAAVLVRKLGLKPGTRLEQHEGAIDILVLDATLWARVGYLATLVLVDAERETVLATFHVKE